MSVEDLINQSTRDMPRGCFVKYINTVGGELKEYWDLIEEKEKAMKGSVVRASTARILSEHFDIDVSRDQVGDHFNNRCSCRRGS